MTLGPGARLGPYEVLSPLGAGGMGEVYRARDTRLGRDVALKALPADVARDPERLARLRREAQLLASLNHPHVAAIHGLEELDSQPLLVLELVEGEDLAERLKRGPVPVDEALEIAKQVAEGLEAAHEKGIVHRDLKPANVKLTPDGEVKVLDFGLAKAHAGDRAASDADASHSPTLTQVGSESGVILGTAAYMSPEQARGKPVDKRADVWAFGVVLYEMLAGRRLFRGETVSDTLAAVLTREPDWGALPPAVPRSVRDLLHDCLARDPKLRLHDMADARLALQRAAGEAAEPRAVAVAVPAWRRALPWALAAAGLVLAVSALLVPWRRAPPALPLRLTIGLGADVSLAVSLPGAGPAVTLSPDGRLLAFVAFDEDKVTTRLFVRRLDQLRASPLAGTEGARNHFFSPDGQWIGFFADGQLKRVAVGGGAPVTLAEAPNDRGGTWSEDGTILFTPNSLPSVGLTRVPASGGASEVATRPDAAAGEVTHRWPQALAGGSVLFTAHRTLGSYEDASIVVQRLPDGPRKVVVAGGYYGRYLPSGHVVYMHDGTLFAVPFDLARLEVKGAAVPVIEDLVGTPRTGGAQFAASGAGTFVYLAGHGGRGRFSVQWLDRAGKLSPLRATPGHYRNLQFSPDGRRLAMQIFDGRTSDVWVYEWTRDAMSRLTFDAVGLTTPVWSPDGDGIAYSSMQGRELGRIYWQRADGTGTPQPLTESRNFQVPDSWHPSGKHLAFDELAPQSAFDVMILPTEREDASRLRKAQPAAFLNSRFNEMQAAFSPNGQWLAYVSNESGRFEVYVRPFPGPGGKWQVSTEGGFYPTWSRNGREILFETADQRLMVVSYSERAGSFLADAPRLGSPARVPTQQGIRGFDLHPDGQRFAILQEVTEPGDTGRDEVVLVLSFFDELRRLAPAR